MEQHELTNGRLLDENGNLNEAGYAFSLVKEYRREDIKAGKSRIKEWDYYYFGNHDIGIALTIADNSYMDLCSATFFDFKKKTYCQNSRMHAFSNGKRNLPPTSEIGDVKYLDNRVLFIFNNDGKKRELVGSYENFRGKEKLTFHLTVTKTRDDTMVIATPFNKDKHFYYNQKSNNLLCSGDIKLGDKGYRVENMQGVLDWGRGVWTRVNTWYWASMNDVCDGHTVGFNLGYGFGDTSKASENMFFFDDKAFKMDDVIFEIPKDKAGKEEFMKTWRMLSRNKDINLTFTPLIHRKGGGNAIVINSIQNQIFGIYNGTFTVEGKTYKIENCYGFAEKVYNRW